MVEVQSLTIEQVSKIPECLHASAFFLQQRGIRTDFLYGLPDTVTFNQLQGRMRELSFPEDFPIVAVMTQDPILRDAALATLRFFALDNTYVHRMAAAEALATIPGEEYVNEIIEREKRAVPSISAPVRQQIIGTTIGQTAIS